MEVYDRGLPGGSAGAARAAIVHSTLGRQPWRLLLVRGGLATAPVASATSGGREGRSLERRIMNNNDDIRAFFVILFLALILLATYFGGWWLGSQLPGP